MSPWGYVNREQLSRICTRGASSCVYISLEVKHEPTPTLRECAPGVNPHLMNGANWRFELPK